MLIELKRDKTPREIVAQALDYASWMEKLKPDKTARIDGGFRDGQSLAAELTSNDTVSSAKGVSHSSLGQRPRTPPANAVKG